MEKHKRQATEKIFTNGHWMMSFHNSKCSEIPNAFEMENENEVPNDADKVEKFKKIQHSALRNGRRKNSSVASENPIKKRSIDWIAESGTRFRGKVSGDRKIRARRDSHTFHQVLSNGVNNTPDHELKLPPILKEDSRKSVSLKCRGELKNEMKKKLSFEPTMLDNKNLCNKEGECEPEKLKMPPIALPKHHLKEKEQIEDGNSLECKSAGDHGKEGELGFVNGLCGHVSHKRSTSRKLHHKNRSSESSDETQALKEDETIDDEQKQVRISEYYAGKVNDFLKGNQPGPSPKSLKVAKRWLDKTKAAVNKSNFETSRTGKMTSIGNEILLDTNLYMNPFTRPDGTLWYYTAKEGRCRYLRVPMTPALTVEEIFHDDSIK